MYVIPYWSANTGKSMCESPLENVYGGACGVMVIVVGNGHGDTSSIPGRD